MSFTSFRRLQPPPASVCQLIPSISFPSSSLRLPATSLQPILSRLGLPVCNLQRPAYTYLQPPFPALPRCVPVERGGRLPTSKKNLKIQKSRKIRKIIENPGKSRKSFKIPESPAMLWEREGGGRPGGTRESSGISASQHPGNPGKSREIPENP